jgi:hypothetical protein
MASLLLRPLTYQEAAFVQEVMVRSSELARQAPWESREALAQLEQHVKGLGPRHFLARWSLPIIVNHVSCNEGALAKAEVMRVALACKLYARQKGKAPERLEQLVPVFFKKLPVDPFTGKLLEYRRHAGRGFALYSLGPNAVDNLKAPHGPADSATSAGLDLSRKADDVVWVEP